MLSFLHMKRLYFVFLIVVIVAGVGLAAIMSTFEKSSSPSRVPMNFAECAAAGHPVMESYPRQCRTSDGRLFVEEIEIPVVPPASTSTSASTSTTPVPTSAPSSGSGKESATGECFVGGCSSQICSGSPDAVDMVTTCEFRAEYACYRLTKCERQSETGKCGWTPTVEFISCLSNPSAIE